MNLRISSEGSIHKAAHPSVSLPKKIGKQDARIERAASHLPEAVSEAEIELAERDIEPLELEEEVAEQKEPPQPHEEAVLVVMTPHKAPQGNAKAVAKDVNSFVHNIFLNMTAKRIEKIQKNIAKKMEKERQQDKERRHEEDKRATRASDERRHAEKKYEERRVAAKQREAVHTKDDTLALEQERVHERHDKL